MNLKKKNFFFCSEMGHPTLNRISFVSINLTLLVINQETKLLRECSLGNIFTVIE